MCLIVFKWAPNSQIPLTLAANRDEFHQRPSLDAHFWEDDPAIFAGRDIEKGGTWLGIAKQKNSHTFKLAALTNFRCLDRTDYQHSRGEVTQNFLRTQHSAQAYTKQLNFDQYAGFNGLFFDGESLVYCHHERNKKPEIITLEEGIYGLSNAKLNTSWPKVERTKAAFSKSCTQQPFEHMIRELFTHLKDTTIANDNELPQTGVGIELERMLSPAFIISPSYGTRTSTVVVISHEQSGQSTYFEERQFSPKGKQIKAQIKTLKH